MRMLLTAIAFAVATLTFSTAADAQTAVYDPATGGVTFEGVSDLVGLRINSAGGILVPGEATDLDGAISPPFGVTNDQAPNFIEYGNLLGLNFASAFAGNILPTGLFQSEIDIDLEFLYRTSANPGEDQRGEITGGVPEPTSLALIGLGLTGIAVRRRR